MDGVAVSGDRRRQRTSPCSSLRTVGGSDRCARRASSSPATPPPRRPPTARSSRHAIPVQLHMLGDRRIRLQRRRQHETDLILLHHIGGAVARAGLRPAIRDQLHPERRAVVIRRLARVPHVKLHIVRAVERQKILRALRLFRLSLQSAPYVSPLNSGRVVI